MMEEKTLTTQTWIRLLLLLLVFHSISSLFYYERMRNTLPPEFSIDMPVAKWGTELGGGDAGAYLRSGIAVAGGHSVSIYDQGRYHPFVYWAPGAPWTIGQVLRITQAKTIFPYIVFVAILDFIVGWVVVLTASRYTRNFRVLALTALLTALCFPLRQYYFSTSVTASEQLSALPLALANFFLTGFFIRMSSRTFSTTKTMATLAAVGASLGIASLIRDSLAMYTPFLAGSLLLMTLVRWRTRWLPITVGLVLLVGATQLVRAPIKIWNKKRVGVATVSSSGSAAIWREGLWTQHDIVDWYYTSGIGFGYYLDSATAKKVKNDWAEGKGSPLNSAITLAGLAAKNPLKALWFKVSRYPVLFMGTLMWPKSELTPTSIWCLLFYATLLVYLVACAIRKVWPIEVTYLFLVFLWLSSWVIHFEFRYSYPIWLGLLLLPAAWARLYSVASNPDSEKAVTFGGILLPKVGQRTT